MLRILMRLRNKLRDAHEVQFSVSGHRKVAKADLAKWPPRLTVSSSRAK